MKTLLLLILISSVALAELTPAFLVASNRTAPATEIGLWLSRVSAAGGTLAGDSEAIATALIDQITAASYSAKIVYLLPLLGSNLAAARVPLRDSLNVGIATNYSFVDGDFSQSTGLQGNGSTKYLSLGIKIGQLGISGNCGLGWWETSFTGSGNVEPLGYGDGSPDNRWVIDLRSSLQAFRAGANATGTVSLGSTASNGHYYGQRSTSTMRTLYKAGSVLATSTTSDTVVPAYTDSSSFITAFASNYHGTTYKYPGRCAVAYLTDGTMSDAEVAAFHTLLQTYLITPTGR